MTSAISYFDFTCFCDISSETLGGVLQTICDKYCFQQERCETTEKLHYQGRMHMKVKIRMNTLSTKLKKLEVPMHLSITSDVNKNNYFYVMKDETRVDGPWKFGDDDDDNFIADWEEDVMKLKPYPWQLSILELMKITRDRRTVHVIIDKSGCKGKSTLIDMMVTKKMGYRIPYMKSYKELTQYVCSLLKELGERSPKNFCFDIPRKINYESIFSAIETIKSGTLHDGRYKATVWKYNTPNVFVFTNEVPEFDLLTKDRWKFWKITDDFELIKFSSVSDGLIDFLEANSTI